MKQPEIITINNDPNKNNDIWIDDVACSAVNIKFMSNIGIKTITDGTDET